jgi:tetratricopeptide (TPR) repeat protein
MRKFFLATAFALVVTSTFAQDLKDVQEKISKGKYDEAREKLDKFMADPKNANNANAFYYKGVINNYMAQTDSAGKLTYNASKEAFDAYKKTLQLEPKNVLMTIDQNMGLFQLFDMHYNKGVKAYNNKSYDAAFKSFKDAVEVQDYIRGKSFSLPTYTPPVLDTQLLNLTASSAYLAKQQDVAIPYFERIANAKVKGTPEYREIYALVSQYYLNKKDDANATKYLALGKELYPDEDYWLGLEFGNVGTDKEAKLKRYEELIAKYPTNASLALDYAIEQFNYTYVWEKKPADYTARQTKLQTGLDKALAMNAGNGTAHFIVAQHYYSQIFDLEDARRAIRGATAADAAKKKDLSALIDKKYDQLMDASQKAFDVWSKDVATLKTQDKTNYRKVTDYLIDYYTRKKMNDKVAFYTTKKGEIK